MSSRFFTNHQLDLAIENIIEIDLLKMMKRDLNLFKMHEEMIIKERKNR